MAVPETAYKMSQDSRDFIKLIQSINSMNEPVGYTGIVGYAGAIGITGTVQAIFPSLPPGGTFQSHWSDATKKTMLEQFLNDLTPDSTDMSLKELLIKKAMELQDATKPDTTASEDILPQNRRIIWDQNEEKI